MIICGKSIELSFERSYRVVYELLHAKLCKSENLYTLLRQIVHITSIRTHLIRQYMNTITLISDVWMSYVRSHLFSKHSHTYINFAYGMWMVNRTARHWTFLRTCVRLRIALGRLQRRSARRIRNHITRIGFVSSFSKGSQAPICTVRHSLCPFPKRAPYSSSSHSSSSGESVIVLERKRRRDGIMRSLL